MAIHYRLFLSKRRRQITMLLTRGTPNLLIVVVRDTSWFRLVSTLKIIHSEWIP